MNSTGVTRRLVGFGVELCLNHGALRRVPGVPQAGV